MYRLADILCIFVEYNIMRINDAYNVLSKVLTPKWRNDKLLLKKIIDIIRCSDSTFISMIHFSSFDILNNGIIYERDLSIILNICETESKKQQVYNYYKHYSDLGDDNAMTIYGYLIWKRKECSNENPEFIRYLKKAADLGNPAANALMGLLLQKGDGIEADLQKSKEYIINYVQKGSDIAFNLYALDLILDHRIESNAKKGIYYYKKAIDECNSNSLFNYGNLLLNDTEHIYFDIENNAEEGGKYIKKAADRGNVTAMKCYSKYIMFGTLPKNKLISSIYLVKAAIKGDEESTKKIILENPNMQSAEYRNKWLEKAYKININKKTKDMDINFLNSIDDESSEDCTIGIFDMIFGKREHDEKKLDEKERELIELADKGDFNAMSSIHDKIYKAKKIKHDSYEYFEQEASKYEQILLDYKKDANKKFVDDNFRPFKHWKRIEELVDAPLFQKDLIDTSFIEQGKIGNCCLISALSRFASHKDLIPELFNCKLPNEILGVVPNSINLKCGAVVVYIRMFGRKTPVLIDTLIPCDNYGRIIISHPTDKNKSPWFCLFEKAMIKANGSFLHIDGILFERSIYSIHLSYFKSLLLHQFGSSYKITEYFDKNKVCIFNYDTINRYLNKGFNINATDQDLKNKKRHGFVFDNGISYDHSYLIYNAKSYKGINFICLRNPWGCQEWEGRYSRYSKIMSSDIKQFLDYDNCPRGTFWISEDDFFKHFNLYDIVKPVRPNWHAKMFSYKLKYVKERKADYSDHQTFAIHIQQEIPKDKKCTIHFIIENKRYLYKPNNLSYKMFVAQVNGEKINLEKIKDVTKFASFTNNYSEYFNEFTFDVSNHDEIVSVTLFQYDGDPGDNYCYVNVICKYQFIMYDIDQPDILYPDISQ